MILGGDRFGNTAEADLDEWPTATRRLSAYSTQLERSFRRDLSGRSGALERGRSEATNGLGSGLLR